MKIRIALCDDDCEYMKNIEGEIKSAVRHVMGDEFQASIFNFKDGDELIASYAKEPFDAVFLDVELERNLGFDVARQLVKICKDIPVIYMSSHDHYVNQAFVCRPLGFVRKNKFAQDVQLPLANLKEYLERDIKKITFVDGRISRGFSVRDIVAVSVIDHYLTVKTNSSCVDVRDQLTRVEQELLDSGFIKVNRSCLVNMYYISRVEKDSVMVSDGHKFDVSRNRRKQVNEEVSKYRND